MIENKPNGDGEGERGASRKASKILSGVRTILRDVDGMFPLVWRMSRLLLWRREGRSENLPGGILFVPRKTRIGIPPRRRCNVHDPPGLYGRTQGQTALQRASPRLQLEKLGVARGSLEQMYI